MIRTRALPWLLAVLLVALGIAAHPTAVGAAAPAASTPSTVRACASVDIVLAVVVATSEPYPSTPVGPKTRVWGSNLLSRFRVGLSTAALPDRIRGLTLQLRQVVIGVTVYVNGDPVNLSDPSGHNPCSYEGTGDGGCTAQENDTLAASDRGATGAQAQQAGVTGARNAAAGVADHRATYAAGAGTRRRVAVNGGDGPEMAEPIPVYVIGDPGPTYGPPTGPQPSYEGAPYPPDFATGDPNSPWSRDQVSLALALPTGGDHPYITKDKKSGKPVRLKGGQGFLDDEGNRWVKDPTKPNEWDVQHPDGVSHTNVGEDGNVTHGKDRFPGSKATETGGVNVGTVGAAGAAGAGAGVIIWWGLKIFSPACGPAAPLCAVFG